MINVSIWEYRTIKDLKQIQSNSPIIAGGRCIYIQWRVFEIIRCVHPYQSFIYSQWVDYLVQCALIPFFKIDPFWPFWRTYAERAKRVSNLRYTTRATFFIICTFQIQRKVYPLTGFWPFRSERPFGFLTPFRCEAPPNGFLTVSQREAFWVFETVSLRVRRFGF